MAKKKDKPPAPIVTLTARGIVPATAWDAELLAGASQGSEFDLVLRSKRSTPHNSKYWAELGQIVRATEAYPNKEKMHQWVKMRLGYVETIYSPTGDPIADVPDSTAFDKMDQTAFNLFYKQAARLILEDMGIDLADLCS